MTQSKMATTHCDDSYREHKMHWWWLKLTIGATLILGVVVQFGFGVGLSQMGFSRPVAQLMVVIGVALYVWNYSILKTINSSMQNAQYLVTEKGLFSMIRHPMYFADLIYYLGLSLLWPSALSLFLYSLGVLALLLQSREEDRWAATKFGQNHASWKASTKLIIPRVY